MQIRGLPENRLFAIINPAFTVSGYFCMGIEYIDVLYILDFVKVSVGITNPTWAIAHWDISRQIIISGA